MCGARTQDRGPGSYGTRTGIGRHLDPTDSKTSKRSRKTEHIGLTQSPADRCAALAAPLRARQRPWAAVVSERSAQLHVDGKAAGGALELQHLLELCPPTCPRLLPAVPRTSLVLSPAVLLQAAALLGPERQTPRETVLRLREQVVAALGDEAVKQRLAGIAYVPVADRSEEFALFIKAEIAELGKLVQQFHLSAD